VCEREREREKGGRGVGGRGQTYPSLCMKPGALTCEISDIEIGMDVLQTSRIALSTGGP